MKRLKELFFRNESGFSLAEVMVAAGMLGGLSLAIMQITKNANKVSKSVGQSVEIMETSTQMAQAMRIEAACTQTLAGATVVDVDSLPTLVPDMFGKGGRTVVTSTVPANRIGSGAGAITIQSITVENYNESGSMGAPINERYGTVDLTVIIQKGNNNSTSNIDPNNLGTHQQSSYGAFQVTKRYNGIQVTSNPAGVIQTCQADSSQYLAAACDMLGGVMANSALSPEMRCHNIEIYNTGNMTAPTTDTRSWIPKKFSLITRGNLADNTEGSMKSEGGLVVGSQNVGGSMYSRGDAAEQTSPGIGNAYVQNYLSLGPDSSINMTAGNTSGDMRIQNNLEVGLVAGTGEFIANNDATVRDNLVVEDNSYLSGLTAIGLGADPITPIWGANERMRIVNGWVDSYRGTSRTLLNYANNSGNDVITHINTTTPLLVREANQNRFSVDENGTIRVFNTTGAVRVTIGSGTDNLAYRPSYIENMPVYASGGLTATQRKEIPTKKWTLDALYHFMSDQADFSSLLAGMNSVIANSPFEVVARYICDNTRVRTGAGYVAGIWNAASAQCRVDAQVCGRLANAYPYPGGRCNTHYTTNYNATGSLYVVGTGRFDNYVNIYNGYLYVRNSYIRAATYVYANSYVFGTTYIRGYGTAKTGLSGVCGRTGCATKFGRFRCNGLGVMVGLANGYPLCANVGGGNPGYNNF